MFQWAIIHANCFAIGPQICPFEVHTMHSGPTSDAISPFQDFEKQLASLKQAAVEISTAAGSQNLVLLHVVLWQGPSTFIY